MHKRLDMKKFKIDIAYLGNFLQKKSLRNIGGWEAEMHINTCK